MRCLQSPCQESDALLHHHCRSHPRLTRSEVRCSSSLERNLYSSVFFHARVFHAGGRLCCVDACRSDDALIVSNDRNRRGLGRVRIGEMVKAAETHVHICEADRPTNGAGLEDSAQ